MSHRRPHTHTHTSKITQAWLKWSDYTTLMSMHAATSGTATKIVRERRHVHVRLNPNPVTNAPAPRQFWGFFGRQRKGRAAHRYRSVLSGHMKPTATLWLSQNDDMTRVRVVEGLSTRPVVDIQHRCPQIPCHCAGPSTRRGWLAQPGGASSAGPRRTVRFPGPLSRCCCGADGDGRVHSASVASGRRDVADRHCARASSQSRWSLATSANTFQNKNEPTRFLKVRDYFV